MLTNREAALLSDYFKNAKKPPNFSQTFEMLHELENGTEIFINFTATFYATFDTATGCYSTTEYYVDNITLHDELAISGIYDECEIYAHANINIPPTIQ